MMNCLIVGVGGQGTVLASKLLAQAAMDKGLFVRTAETIGMAQRGGSVVSHVRMGETVHSPLIPFNGADMLIALEPAEAARALPYLSKGGTLVVCTTPIKPQLGDPDAYHAEEIIAYLKKTVSDIVVVDGADLIKRLGSVKPINVAMLGHAIATGKTPLNLADIENVINARIPEKYKALNIKALYDHREAQA